MNNLKRVLSLGLTGTMLAGMMVMSASAANKEFTDANEITHVEAVNTMAALGVIKGKDTGAFDPKGTVTRAEMAKIVCVMLNGGTDPTLGTSSVPVYSDTANHWARSYIEYCSNLGIVAGQGDGTFNPDGTVTGSQAAKMFLVALGYDSNVFGFTGIDWEIAVNTQANSAKLYDELKGINASAGLSRDNAAQMASNTLDAFIMDKSYESMKSDGEITYKYALSTTTTFLNDKFDAYTFIGTMDGNKDTNATNVDGQIRVTGRLDTTSAEYDKNGDVTNNRSAYFPSDLDISNIGEEVKVIFKDGKSGTDKLPDKNDTIYGVFNTGKTEVYEVTKNDIQDSESSSKVKFGDNKYDVAATVKVVTNYAVDKAVYFSGTTVDKGLDTKDKGTAEKPADGLQKELKQQKSDYVKFVCDDNGKINAAYVVTDTLTKVTSVSSSKISLSGVGSIDIDGNDIYDGIAKDDVVVYNALYTVTPDKDDSTFIVKKAETVEGELTGYKKTEKVTVGGTTYKTYDKKLASNVTDDAVTTESELSDKLNEDVTLYLIGGLVGAVDAPDTTTSSYALVTGFNKDGKVDADYDTLNVKVRLADGTTAKYDVHKDSTYNGTDKLKGHESELTEHTPALVKYTMSGGEIKIKEIAKTGNTTTGEKLWNKTTKALNYTEGETIVASTDAVFFTRVSRDKYYTYTLRSLGDIKGKGFTVQYFLKDSKVVAAFAELNSKPNGDTSDTLYGMVTDYFGTVKDDDTTYQKYGIWTGKETIVLVEEDNAVADLTVGNIVTFDETNDGKYDTGDFTVISKYNENTETYTYTAMKDEAGNTEVTKAVAVDSYNSSKGILTYFTKVNKAEDNTYAGDKETSASITVADDVVIVYVDADEQEDGADNGVASFDSSTGNANAIYHVDSDGVVDAIIVETSGKLSLSQGFPAKA